LSPLDLVEEAVATYNRVLRSELFGAETNGLVRSEENSSQNSSSLHSSSPPRRNLLQFKSPEKPAQVGIDSPFRDVYSTSPIKRESQEILSSPRTATRPISKSPFKVLDAPDLKDDFYLNLLDWSSLNVLSVGLGNNVYLWSAATCTVTKLCSVGPYDSVTSVGWMEKGTHLAVGTNNGFVQVWDVTQGKRVRNIAGHGNRVGSLSWNRAMLASGSRDREIHIHDVRTSKGVETRIHGHHRQEVCGLKWSPNGQQLASGGNDNRLIVWDKANITAPLYQFDDHCAAVKAIAWSPHQNGLLASGGGTADKRICFRNTNTGATLSSHDTGSQVCNLAWSLTANELVSTHGYSQNQIAVWKYPTMTPIATLTGHTSRVLYLALSPDGQTIATGAGDETLRFWNVFAKSSQPKEASTTLDAFSQIR